MGSVGGDVLSVQDQHEEIDWRKVGKVHDRDADVNEVIMKEMARVNKAFELKLQLQ